ncbi:MAG: PAS domain S-box protein [Calditrichia bacterium]
MSLFLITTFYPGILIFEAPGSKTIGWFLISFSLLITLYLLVDKFLNTRNQLKGLKKRNKKLVQQKDQMEQRLFEREQTHGMLEKSPVILLRCHATPDLPVAYVSENIHQLGYKASDLIEDKTHFASLVHPDDLQDVRAEVFNFIRQNHHNYQQTFRIRTKDGSYRWMNDRIVVVRDANGIPKYLEGILIDISEQKILENSLLSSQQEYQALFNDISDPVMIIDQETNYCLDVNDAAVTTYGYSRGEFLSLTSLALHLHEDKRQSLEDTMSDDGSSPKEYEHQKKNGERIFVEVLSTKGTYKNRPVFISTHRIITQRKIIELEREQLFANLKQSESFLNTVLDTIPNPIYVKDTKGRFIGYNKKFIECLGDANVDWHGKTTLDVSTQTEVGIRHHDKDMELFTTGGQQVFESCLTFNDGIAHDVIMYRDTFNNPDGSVGGLVGSVLDITERKRIENELIEHKALLEEAQRIAHMGVWTWSLKDNAFSWTDPLFEMLGLEKTQKVGYELYRSILHPDDQENILPIFAEAIKSNTETVEVENRAFDKQGKLKHFRVIAKLLRNAENRVERIIGIGLNITTHVENEQKLLNLISEVKQVNAELNDFAHIVSHDLKAPLRSINSLSQWLISDYGSSMNEEARNMLELLGNQVTRMHALIEGVLNYSKATSQKEEKADVNLTESVNELIKLLAPPENISITVETPLPKLFLSKTRIEQVFQNLISNAIKYMDKPIGKVQIAAVRGTDTWLFSVTDNGPGIPSSDFEKIFRIFQTVGDQQSFENTGIGLTVVKKIITLYGGSIWVESTLGEGTTFCFTLPAQENLEKTSSQNQRPGILETTP